MAKKKTGGVAGIWSRLKKFVTQVTNTSTRSRRFRFTVSKKLSA
jgi:hypothetical protein